jgi:hypothetical protein
MIEKEVSSDIDMDFTYPPSNVAELHRKHDLDKPLDIEYTTSRHIRNNSRDIDNEIISKIFSRSDVALSKKDHIDSEESSKSSLWHIGGLQCNKSLITFGVNILFSTSMVVFCVVKLTQPTLTPSDKLLYTTMLSSIVSLHAPSPLQHQSKNK